MKFGILRMENFEGEDIFGFRYEKRRNFVGVMYKGIFDFIFNVVWIRFNV